MALRERSVFGALARWCNVELGRPVLEIDPTAANGTAADRPLGMGHGPWSTLRGLEALRAR
jgi:hypothetical protein